MLLNPIFQRVKKFVLLLSCNFFFLITNTYSQTPICSWAKSAGNNDRDVGSNIAVDRNGNSYVTGTFWSSSITFGGITLTNDSTNGYHDIFIVKYNNFGNVVWAKSAGGSNYDVVSGIAVDSTGNTYVTGHFISDKIIFGNDTLYKSGYAGLFVAKYDSSGNVMWAKTAGGGGNYGFDIAVDYNGNCYVAGDFINNIIIFGSDTLSNDTTAVFGDIFIVKYDASGNVIWAKSAGGSYDDYCSGIAVDDSSNIYITGRFDSRSIIFGHDTLTSNAVGMGVVGNIFVAKYDSFGNVVWAKRAGGGYGDGGSDIAVDKSSNIYITGYFTNSSIAFGSYTLISKGGRETFIVKYDALGNVIWAKNGGGIYDDFSFSIAIDKNNNSYITGYFDSPSIYFDTDTLFNNGDNDIFVVKYDTSGNVVWAKSVGGNLDDGSYSIAVDNNDNCFITGSFESHNISFDLINLTNGSTNGNTDMFIAMFGSNFTSIKEISNEIKIIVYPNPIRSHAMLIAESSLKDAYIKVENIWGKTVMEIELVSDNTVLLDCENLPSGLYFIRLIKHNNLIATKKIVITH